MISLEEVSKQYDGRTALAPTTLRAAPERCLALIGPSGCGKSTLLRLVVGLLTPDSGTIRIGDDELRPGSVRRLRHRMGYVIQEGGLFPHLSAGHNVTLMAQDLGWEA